MAFEKVGGRNAELVLGLWQARFHSDQQLFHLRQFGAEVRPIGVFKIEAGITINEVNLRQVLSEGTINRNDAVGGPPPSRRLTAWAVGKGNSPPAHLFTFR